jgi:hypothetical protein
MLYYQSEYNSTVVLLLLSVKNAAGSCLDMRSGATVRGSPDKRQIFDKGDMIVCTCVHQRILWHREL